MPKTPESLQETTEQDESLFTPHEKAALAEFLRHFGKDVTAEDMTDGFIMEECETMTEPFDNPPFDGELGQILTQIVEKARRAKQEIMENITSLACKQLPGKIGESVNEYLLRYVKNKERHPFSIRAQMASLGIKTLLEQDETIKEPDTGQIEGCESVLLMESYIAALHYWSCTAGIRAKFKKSITGSDRTRKEFAKAAKKVQTEHQITGTIENINLDQFISTLRKSLIARGVIVKKSDEEIQADTNLQIAIAMKNRGVA